MAEETTLQQPVLETVTCPLCGGRRAEQVHRGPDYFLQRPGAFTLVRCQDCGLIYQNPRPPLEHIGLYYPDEYGSYGSAQQGLRTRPGLLGALIRRGMDKRCRLLNRSVVPVPGRGRRLLDIGCASGLFLEAMQRYADWNVAGVELNETAARATSKRLGVPVFVGAFEQAQYPDGAFDAVTLWDVLEHFHDPLAALHEIRRILRPGGALFIRVPNAGSYVRRLGGRYWVGYDMPRHMTVFTRTTLLRALGETGFDWPLHTYTSASYLAAMHSLRFALDDGRVRPQHAAAVHRVLLHPAVRAAAWLPFRLADAVADGSALEVLALAREA